MIDLPFIGKIKIDNLTLDQAQNTLVSVIGKFYKNLIHKEFLKALVEPKGDAVIGAIAIALSHYGNKLQ